MAAEPNQDKAAKLFGDGKDDHGLLPGKLMLELFVQPLLGKMVHQKKT